MTLSELKDSWRDVPEHHKLIHESFCEFVNLDPLLDAHRTYIETNVWGFGERSFWWMWKLILESFPDNPKLLEIGVFRAATLSVWKLLRPDAQVFGITPLNTSGGVWESDYAADIKKIHDDFELEQPTIFVGKSNEPNVIKQATQKYDLLLVDGDHSYEGALFDLNTYAHMIKVGGWLVVDDAACDLHEPWGYFQGIREVTDALNDFDKSDFEFQFNVVHNMVYRRVK